MVMPEVGLDVTPTRPTILELTVTKKNAKTAIRMAARARAAIESRNPSTPGTRVRTERIPRRISSTVFMPRSRSVRSTLPTSPDLPIWARPSLNDSIMVGIDFTRVMIPPVATAPAPMYLT